MEDPVRQIVHALKYSGWSTVAQGMAFRMAALDFPRELEDETPVVIPVPLAATRLRQRGYNQAGLLATGIASARGWELQSDVLFRTRSSGSQTHLHPAERRANVANAFRAALDRPDSIGGGHALLVDDVWTTGATTMSCADALLLAGARAVSAVTFARALPEIERHSRRLDSLVKP
jgi:ComF family protein